jgi:predicted dehydrogenase
MKTAMVGLGYWGPNLLRNLITLRGVASVVCVDQSVDRLAALLPQYPSIEQRLSLEQALHDPEVNSVVLATPVNTHAALARRALEAGCHVLVEKPLTSSSIEARELVELAAERRLTLMVGHTFLFSPRVELIARYVAEGRLGRIEYATSARLNLGLHRADVDVIWDLAAHDFSILFYLLGEFPSTVQTTGRGVLRPQALDTAFINMEFPSGIVTSVSVSWMSPRKVRNTVIVGNRQMVIYDDLDQDEPVKIYDKGVEVADPQDFGEHQLTYRQGDLLVPHVPPREPLAQELEHFLASVETGASCRSDGAFGLRVIEVLEAAEASWLNHGEAVGVERAVHVSRPPTRPENGADSYLRRCLHFQRNTARSRAVLAELAGNDFS